MAKLKPAFVAKQAVRTPLALRLAQVRHQIAHFGWFIGGLAFGFTTLTFTLASVPRSQILESSSAESVELQDAVSELQAHKTPKVDFDSDIAALSARERLYREDPRSAIRASRGSRVRVVQNQVKPATAKRKLTTRSK